MPYSSEDLLRCLVPLKLVIIGENPGPEHHAIRTAIHRAFHGGHYSADSSEAYFAAGEDLGVSVLEADLANGPDLAKQIIADARASAEKFREPHRKVAERLVQCYFPPAWVGTPQMFIQQIITAATP